MVFTSILLLAVRPHKHFAKVPVPPVPYRIVRSEYIYNKAPFPSCHASTLAETQHGLCAAFFGGTAESKPDVGIYVSLCRNQNWSVPVRVASGVGAKGKPVACWNPVLFQPKSGPLTLYYKIGKSPRSWHGMVMQSSDEGATWSTPRRLDRGIIGPVKNKPIEFDDGVILSPSSRESTGEWRVHMEISKDHGASWESTEVVNDPSTVDAIQPTLLEYPDGKIQALMRTRQGLVYQSWSVDEGLNWSPCIPTTLPNPNSGIDAVSLADGRQLIVYNRSKTDRCPLNVAISFDGETWKPVVTLETNKALKNGFAYPAVIQTRDGLVHITYTYDRKRIKHVVLDLSSTSN